MASTRHFFGCLAAAIAVIIAVGVDGATGQKASTDFGRCLAITDNAARLRCFEGALGKPQPATSNTGAWRLARAPDPHGGPDGVSIMHTADTSRSDLDLAGLTLRCSENGIEALVVVIEPRAPRSRPRIRISADGDSAAFSASVVQPFSMLQLPNDAATLITGPWKVRSELAIEIEGDGTPVRGSVPLAGLPAALQLLAANCASR
jgi:hypothetical protein